ncbi:two-component regulator propeller domain-containing protein [Pleionea sp. CnH1-48]|uniref:two-component regulator propeller domain-containing protein n=1 Tax=Pleionea sp. CnH1-48 TaxID=2954494 RepID=UPI0020985B56|nr:two-component regulator propeller domain-containing protein [Pleionea sp. CnH1-48]MCO7226292.1 response regulator [Pleionea sp. CnH1-48]
MNLLLRDLSQRLQCFALKYLTLLFCGAFILINTSAFATTAELSFNRITSADGLPQNNITALLQDQHGFVWIGTYEGLHKYDGYDFISFTHERKDPTTLSNNVITALVEDKDGMIWIGTESGGLNRLNPKTGKFKRYENSIENFESLSHNNVTALYIDKSDRLWVGTFNSLNQYIPETDSFIQYYGNPLDSQSIPEGTITAITSDGDSDLYVATKNTLSHFNIEHLIFTRFESESAPTGIESLYLDVDNSLWIGTQRNGLYHLLANGRTFEHYDKDNADLSSNHVTKILRDSLGNLWVGTERGGLNLKPKASRTFLHFKNNTADIHSLSINDVWSLLEDRSGQIWIGTAGGGINKTTPHFQNFSRLQHLPFDDNSLAHNYVNGIDQDNQGIIWFATLNGIDRYNPTTGEFKHYRQFHDKDQIEVGSRITTLAVDANNKVWFGNQQGQVARLDPSIDSGEVELFQRTAITSSNRAFSLERILLVTHDRMNNIWVATEEGLAMLDSTTGEMLEDFRFAAEITELGISAKHTMLQDDQGIMWFGTRDNGIQRYDPEFRQSLSFPHQPDQESSLSDNTVRSIFQDDSGNLWIGTYKGLNLLKNEDRLNGRFEFRSYYESDGLPNNTIYAITSDASGYIWLSTNRGLSRFDPINNQFKNFTTLDGLPADEFNGNAILKSTNGLLYFGSVSGVAVIKPSGITFSQYKPPLFITQISINHEPLFDKNWEKITQLDLEFDKNNLLFQFSALDLRLPQRIQYSYRLLPEDKQWQYLTGENQIQYGNLAPGNYTFELRSSNSDGFWFDDQYRLQLTITPPVWATWWAYSLYLFLFVSLVSAAVFRHSRKLKEQQDINAHLKRIDKLKDEFLANTSHELRTPLNGIIGVAESLREGIAGPLNDKTLNHLSLIIDSGKRLAHQVDEILDFKKLRHQGLLLNRRPVDLRVAAKVVINLLLPLAEEKKLELINSLPRFLPHVYADENRLRQVLYNLMGNAIKYTQTSGTVELTARILDTEVEICVKDNGAGIPKDKQSVIFKPFEQLETSSLHLKSGTGLGLAVSRQLVELQDGRIWLKSKPSQGSSFYFTLPKAEQEESTSEKAPDAESESFPLLKHQSLNLEPRARNLQLLGSEHTKILIVDDDPLNRQVLNDFLSMQQYQVSEAVDGLDALEILRRNTFDLIIMDVMMPRMSGFEATEKIREHYTQVELPILLLSAKTQPEDISTGFSAGANDYISKPVDRKILVARVKTLLMLREVFESQQERAQLKVMEQTLNRLGRYFPRQLVEKIMASEQQESIQPERRCITVLFADLVGFTEFSDRFEPETVTDILNEFLGEMGKLTDNHNGLLNEVLGDGLVVLFGALEHLDKPTQALKAISLATEMNKAIGELAEKWRQTGLEQHLSLRIGIHQSYVTLGNFGSNELIVFRAVGSGVNLTSRIQGLCQPGEIKVSYPVYAQARDSYDFSNEEEHQFKGFNHTHRVYKLTGY